MRQHWQSASPHIIENVTRWLGTIPAVNLVTRILESGFDLHVDEIPIDASTEQARKLWQSRRHWAANTSIEDDPSYQHFQQSLAADAERQRVTRERFVDDLAGNVCQLLDAAWNRANARWLADHPRNADSTHEPEAPSFSDTAAAVLTRLGYTRKASEHAHS